MTLRSSLNSSCALALSWALSACSGSGTAVVSAGGAASTKPAGGGSSAGGAAAGGASSAGGSQAPGGGNSSGGANVDGGATASGGSVSVGGTWSSDHSSASSNTGGAGVTGGAPAAGGSSAAGGTTATGGTRATGGDLATGGKVAGGATATGGTKATGGATATGGSKPTGGTSSTGGTKAAGGTTSTGGTSTASTSTGVVKSPGCNNTALPAACTSTTTGACKLTINNIERSYYVVLPTNYDPNTAYPIVTAWHYHSGTAEQVLPNGGGGMQNFYGVRAGFPNAIYTTAQGLPATAGGVDYVWQNTNHQDVNFAKAIVSKLETDFCVDQSRIFATGMSYGGIMSSFLGCEAPDVFRALGIIAGGTFGGTQNCINRPIAAWFTHGDADTTVPIANGVTARELFIKNNGCSTTNTQSLVLNSTTTCTIYNECTAGNYPVVWCPVVGGLHTIPSFSTAEITKFFMQF